jgi:hypothetical protein
MGCQCYGTLRLGGTVPVKELAEFIEDVNCTVDFILNGSKLTDLYEEPTTLGEFISACENGIEIEAYNADSDGLAGFCMANFLTYRLLWTEEPSYVDACIEAWRPGLEESVFTPTTSDGDLYVSVTDIEDAYNKGRSILDLCKELKERSLTGTEWPKFEVS